MKELFCEVDMVIMPSKAEGFGLIALEALSAGLPILVGKNSGFARAIKNIPLGSYSIVDSDDPAKWAECIEGVRVRHKMVLQENKILKEHYGKDYCWKKQCEELVDRLWKMVYGEADRTPLFSQRGGLDPETSMIGKATAGEEERKMASEPNANVVADLNKALMNANSGNDKNETDLLMMSPSLNCQWAEFLTPALFSIAVMGQLILVAWEKDFSLENQRPKKGFQFIDHPKSFRACLVQVSSSGWKTFNQAHNNMDAIRINSARVLDQWKKVVRILVQGSAEDVEDILPRELRNIDRKAEECLNLAQAANAKFVHMMELTAELLEVVIVAKGHYKQSQEELQIKREIALAKEEAARKKLEAVPPSVPPSFNTENLMILITKLVEVFSTFQKGSKATKDEESAEIEIRMAKLKMEDLEEEWSSEEDSPDKEQALQLLTRGLEICSEAEALMTQLNRSPEEMEEIAKQALNLKGDVRKFCTKAKAKAGKNPFYTKPPRQARKMANSANSSSSRVAESAIESVRFKIAEARGLLERQEHRYDQKCKELMKGNEELSKVLQSLAEFSPEKIADFDQIRETIIKGIKVLDSVREQWEKMLVFFEFITNTIKVCQKKSLSSFVEYAKVGQKRVLANGYASTDFMRDLMYEEVCHANTMFYVVWSISNTYVEISRDHLMSRIASLGHLIALDPEKDRAAIAAKRNELMEGSQEAQEAIRKYVSEAKDQFHVKVTKRIKKIETELLKALPAEDPAKIDSVKNAIKEADEELDADKF
ncbi:uncharacterized protein [Acropora muricata]|uniref:uncharacterized protein n=1 Tax=Acropora muricata TaxID=159855 RepID=UPI0034E43D4A